MPGGPEPVPAERLRQLCGPATIEGLLARCSFPPAGSAAVCAVSGGADSLALLALAVAAGCDTLAIHVDHGLRPEGEREAEAVEQAAVAMGACFEARHVQVAPGSDLEARARRARYDALPSGTCVGHTADDQAETILLNLLRGAGIDGLSGMRDGGAGARNVRRPILRIRRAEAAALVGALGLTPLHDPSNDDPRYRRNRVRHEVLPLLADVAQRDIVPLLTRSAQVMASDAELLQSMADQLDPTDARSLAAAPGPLARRALRAWLRPSAGPEHHPPSAAEIERVWQVVTGAAVACQLAGGVRVKRSRGRLYWDLHA